MLPVGGEGVDTAITEHMRTLSGPLEDSVPHFNVALHHTRSFHSMSVGSSVDFSTCQKQICQRSFVEWPQKVGSATRVLDMCRFCITAILSITFPKIKSKKEEAEVMPQEAAVLKSLQSCREELGES